MKSIAAHAHFYRALALTGLFFLTACANVGSSVGLSIPIGGLGSIGVSVGSDGRVGGSLGVGVGGATVSVGTSGQLQPAQKTDEDKR
jgi:hypothetical protein